MRQIASLKELSRRRIITIKNNDKDNGNDNDKDKEITSLSLKKDSKESSLSLSLKSNFDDKTRRAKLMDMKVERLVDIYRAENSRPFFYKCYWHLSDIYIEEVVEMSRQPSVRKPLAYFLGSCKRQMAKLGY
jgi:hypothetical protein